MNKTRKFLGVLFEKSIVKSVANKIALGKLEKIDSRVSKKIRKKFLPLTLPNPQDSMNEYCKYILKNFDYQILIDKEIQNETHKMGISLNVDEKIILKILKDLTRENKL